MFNVNKDFQCWIMFSSNPVDDVMSY